MKGKFLSITIFIIIAAMLTTACGTSVTTPSSSPVPENNSKEISGELIVATWAGDPFQSAWQDIVEKFTDETGVDVSIDATPWENLREKCTLEMASGSSSYDVMYVHPMWFEEFVDNDFLVPVEEYATEKEIGEFVTSLVDVYRKDGKLYGLPDFITTQVIAYRTDLFEKNGLKAPGSWDEIIAAAETLRDGDNIYGLTFPGKKGGQLASVFNAIFVSNGGWYFDDNGNPNVNTPEAIEAAEFIGKISEYAPTGFLNYQWDENSNVASAGKAAMAICMVVNSQWLDDAEKSVTAGKWSYAPIKSNKGTPGGLIDSYCWSVAKGTKNFDAAAALVKYLAGTDAQIYFTEKSGTSGATKGYYENTELLDSTPVLGAMKEVFTNSKPYPIWKTWSEEQDVLETGLQEMMSGKITGAQVMEKLQSKMMENLGK